MSKQRNYFKIKNKLDTLHRNKQRREESLARRRASEDAKREQ